MTQSLHIPATFLCSVALGSAIGGSLLAQAQGTRQQEPTFQITDPLEFDGRVVEGPLRKTEIAALLELRVRNGNSNLEEGYGVEMTWPNGEKSRTSTCREWKKAQQQKAYAATTYDMAMQSALIHTCGLLFQLQSARTPVKSLLADPKVSLADVNLLPAEMLTAFTDDEQEQRATRGKTISEVVPEKDVVEAKDTRLTLAFGGFRQSFWEAARADFDGSGFEEIFIFTGGGAEGGTMLYANNVILTRTDPSGALKLIERKK